MKRPKPKSNAGDSASEIGRLRIIAGSLRSRIIEFSTDPRTRPMKDRTREAVFNLLGGKIEGYVAFDLFAGSGILAIEGLSRGAAYSVAIELLPRAAREITLNAKRLGVDNRICVFASDTFDWMENLRDHIEQLSGRFGTDANAPWCVFVCPPYKLWETHTEPLRKLLADCVAAAPDKSLFAVELDESTPLEMLPESLQWQTRTYRPAMMAIGEKA
ncbi:MAG: RsmD family RNA methyltransferase [Pirellulaceae bacterium]|nr:RsmD family RNA methyltransferase [Pirellulaceae bacterium]